MSTSTAKTEPSRTRRARMASPARRSSTPTPAEIALAAKITEFRDYLNGLGLGVSPSVHVNGRAHPTCLVTVDFGQPLSPVRMTPDQAGEFTERLREVAKGVLGRDVNIRVQPDHSNGIYWAGVV